MAVAARGTLTGNRGIIHREGQVLGPSRWSHHAWICCTLNFKGRKRAVMTGRKWTELFFLDEAVALAAGHRPCGYCRRQGYKRFKSAWAEAAGSQQRAAEMDKALHADRIIQGTRTQKRYNAPIDALPAGTMILRNETEYLLTEHHILPYEIDCYGAAQDRPKGVPVDVLTPAALTRVLSAGYAPLLHASASS